MESDIRAAIERLFKRIDAKDTEGFLSFLGDDVMFRFGNADPVTGKPAVGAAVAAFFDSISALSHELQEIVVAGETAICHGQVTYTRHDGSQLSVPFANVFGLRRGTISEYLIFGDMSALYAPA